MTMSNMFKSLLQVHHAMKAIIWQTQSAILVVIDLDIRMDTVYAACAGVMMLFMTITMDNSFSYLVIVIFFNNKMLLIET